MKNGFHVYIMNILDIDAKNAIQIKVNTFGQFKTCLKILDFLLDFDSTFTNVFMAATHISP